TLLLELHQAGLPVEVIVNTIISNPQSFESHLEILEELLNQLDVASQLAYVEQIHETY
ncbi:MAG: hypothetical protein GWN30_31515, partial [Gammaproteobacteria bacterium]|nr:hypothetical protein [Gammaproteobacteria bacterium]